MKQVFGFNGIMSPFYIAVFSFFFLFFFFFFAFLSIFFGIFWGGDSLARGGSKIAGCLRSMSFQGREMGIFRGCFGDREVGRVSGIERWVFGAC